MTKELKQQLASYFQSSPYPVILAYLFGSEARGQTTPLSDVDVAVYLDETLDQRVEDYLPLLRAVNQAVDDGQVDLVYLNDASPSLAYAIIGGELVFCADERRRVYLESTILCSHFDNCVLHERRFEVLRRRFLAGRMAERDLDMIEKSVIEERLEYIRTTLARLQRYQGTSLEAFRGDEDRYRAALYDLQTCLEAVADIGNHLIAALALRRPEDRADIMLILAEAEIISKPLGKRLAEAQGMRNILVHGYLRILAQTVHRVIHKDLGDIEAFCQAVVRYLEGTE